jgi:hypothetical protein
VTRLTVYRPFWLFASWLPHAVLHQHIGMQAAALLAIVVIPTQGLAGTTTTGQGAWLISWVATEPVSR